MDASLARPCCLMKGWKICLSCVQSSCSQICFLLERKNIKASLKQVAFISPTSGLLTGGVNLFVILTQLEGIPAAVLFPVLSGSSTILSLVLSIFVFKEKLAWWQWLGILVGAVAVTLLSIS